MSEENLTCDQCGKGPFKSASGLRLHQQRAKGHVREASINDVIESVAQKLVDFPSETASTPAVAPSVTGLAMRDWWNTPVSGAPAILPEWRQTPRIRSGYRSLTMLRPVCRICEKRDNAPRDWWWGCTHDPYVTMVPHPEVIRDWEDEIGLDGQPTGRRVVKPGTEREVMAYEPRPNHTNRSINGRSQGGYGLHAARWKGCIFPEELRSPHYPNGIANTCEFHDCRSQVGLKDYQSGRYCRQEEAAIAYFDQSGTTLEVGLPESEHSMNRRAAQLAGAPV